jgi:hypothetical protein
VRPANTTVLAGLFDPRWKVEIGRSSSFPVTGKQAFPSSITGTESESAGASSTTRSGAGDPYTLGVEEEYQLSIPTFDLVQHIDTMLAAVTGHELEARINAELMRSVLEIATPVRHNAGDVMRWLTTLRAYVTEIAHEQERGSALPERTRSASSATADTAKDRYHALIDQLQYVARPSSSSGCTYVAVDDPEKAVQVVNGLLHISRRSSPSRRARRSGAARRRGSRRAARWSSRRSRARTASPFRDYADYASVVGQLERSDARRLHAHLVGHSATSSAGNDRDPDLRRGHPR